MDLSGEEISTLTSSSELSSFQFLSGRSTELWASYYKSHFIEDLQIFSGTNKAQIFTKALLNEKDSHLFPLVDDGKRLTF